jgi:hypothetical protein
MYLVVNVFRSFCKFNIIISIVSIADVQRRLSGELVLKLNTFAIKLKNVGITS